MEGVLVGYHGEYPGGPAIMQQMTRDRPLNQGEEVSWAYSSVSQAQTEIGICMNLVKKRQTTHTQVLPGTPQNTPWVIPEGSPPWGEPQESPRTHPGCTPGNPPGTPPVPFSGHPPGQPLGTGTPSRSPPGYPWGPHRGTPGVPLGEF